MMSDNDDNMSINGDETSNDADAPFPTDALPPDFVVEDVFNLTEEQQRHRITFYQAALTAFSVQASNGSMMMKEKYVLIKDVLLRVQNGVSLGSLRRAGYTQVNAWAKKFAVVVSGDSSVLVERMDIPKRKSNSKRRSVNRRSKRRRSTSGRRHRRRIRRKSIRRRSQSESDGDDNNKNNSDSNDSNYTINDADSKNSDTEEGGENDDENESNGVENSENDGLVQVLTHDFDRYRKITYLERLYCDILSQHHGHNKGQTLKRQCAEKFANISKTWTIIFSKTCPGCIQRAPKSKPIAGLRNIITLGLGVRGQVDLVDFQSMPDGPFRFLLNYIDHGVKILFSIPIVAKRASCIAIALYQIFCIIGPPMILQTDNGKEFSGAATTSKQFRKDVMLGKQSVISDELMSEVVSEIRNLWPECRMVHGSPRHSESNGGVERVNRTVQEKLHAWMVKHQSKRWSVGCHLVQWQINTQFHHTVQNVPYVLTFGQKPRVGISDLPLDRSVIDKLHTEAELNMLVDVNSHIESPAADGGNYSIASIASGQSVTSTNKTVASVAVAVTKKTVGSVAAAAIAAMEPPQLDLGRCDWSAVVECMTSLPPPIHCQKEGCTTLVHHVCQGTWEASPEGTEAPGCSTLCRAHHPCFPSDVADPLSFPADPPFPPPLPRKISIQPKSIRECEPRDSPSTQGFGSPSYLSPGLSPAGRTIIQAKTMEEFKKNLDMSSWERDFHRDQDMFGDGEIDLETYIDGMRLNDKRVIMWYIGEDEMDLSDLRNYVPTILVRVYEHVYEVMDDNDDICFASLQIGGEEGLKNMWGSFIKYPNVEFLEHCKTNHLFCDGANNRLDGIEHEVSPRRAATRRQAAKMMDRSARKVMRRVKSKQALIKLGDVVHVPLVQQDRAKVDAPNLTAVVVNINNHFGVCQLAVKMGILRPWYVFHKIRRLPDLGNNRYLNDLEDAYKNWKKMNFVAPRTASLCESFVGGQGIFQCKCKGKCTTNQCKCFKNGRICTSACHRNSKCCENNDHATA